MSSRRKAGKGWKPPPRMANKSPSPAAAVVIDAVDASDDDDDGPGPLFENVMPILDPQSQSERALKPFKVASVVIVRQPLCWEPDADHRERVCYRCARDPGPNGVLSRCLGCLWGPLLQRKLPCEFEGVACYSNNLSIREMNSVDWLVGRLIDWLIGRWINES